MQANQNMQLIVEKAKKLKLLILDVDGVLTDGKLFFDNEGNEYKSFHARDGHGIKLLRQTGVEVAVISGRKSNSVALRMKSLGIDHIYQGHEDKREETGPDTAAGIGIAVDLGQHVAQHIGNREKQDTRAESEAPHGGKLGRADQVRQQQDRDEGRHHVVEIAEMAAGAGAAVDLGDVFAHE